MSMRDESHTKENYYYVDDESQNCLITTIIIFLLITLQSQCNRFIQKNHALKY